MKRLLTVMTVMFLSIWLCISPAFAGDWKEKFTDLAGWVAGGTLLTEGIVSVSRDGWTARRAGTLAAGALVLGGKTVQAIRAGSEHKRGRVQEARFEEYLRQQAEEIRALREEVSQLHEKPSAPPPQRPRGPESGGERDDRSIPPAPHGIRKANFFNSFDSADVVVKVDGREYILSAGDSIELSVPPGVVPWGQVQMLGPHGEPYHLNLRLGRGMRRVSGGYEFYNYDANGGN